MSFDYAKSRATADRLLTRFGQAGKLVVPGAKTGPAHNPTFGPPTKRDVTLAVLAYAKHEIDGTRILATDKKVLLAAGGLAVEPNLDHKLEIAGQEHAILDIRPLAPGGTVVLYEIQARR